MQLSPLLPLLPALASAMPVDSVDKSPASVDTPATLVDTPAISADKPISWVSMQATTPEMIAASAMQLSFIDDIGHVFKGIAEGVAKKAEDLVHDFDPEQCDILGTSCSIHRVTFLLTIRNSLRIRLHWHNPRLLRNVRFIGNQYVPKQTKFFLKQ